MNNRTHNRTLSTNQSLDQKKCIFNPLFQSQLKGASQGRCKRQNAEKTESTEMTELTENDQIEE